MCSSCKTHLETKAPLHFDLKFFLAEVYFLEINGNESWFDYTIIFSICLRYMNHPL